MKKIISLMTVGLLTVSTLAGCGGKQPQGQETSKNKVEQKKEIKQEVKQEIKQREVKVSNPNFVNYKDENDIKYDMKSISKDAEKYYKKYVSYKAPNGGEIHILAQDKVTNEQLLYGYSILSFYLDELEKHGHKGIANKMADNKALLIMPNGSDGDGSTPEQAIFAQPQYQNETANVGGKWYIENDYSHRDSTFEEIFHLVHMQGIGTSGAEQADQALAQKIIEGKENALPKNKDDWGKKGLWGLNAKESLIEWSQEPGSQEAEYIICVIDTYYGMWNAFDGSGALFGEYIAKSREGLKEKDPTGYDILTSFLPTHISSMMRVDPSFTGDFKIYLDNKDKYTMKSQYLQNVRLTGKNNSNLIGNKEDNVLLGNSGNNLIDGGDGNDIVQFTGNSTDYTITKEDNKVMVTDSQEFDGKDTLKNVEIIRFADKDINVSEIDAN